jgi:hypothetical protein
MSDDLLPDANKIIVHHHLGLGDHFVCNGLVNHLCDKYDAIFLPCKTRNFETVKYLYCENTKVNLIPIVDNEYSEVDQFANQNNLQILKIGFEHTQLDNWDKSFYEQLDIPFDYRYSKFSIPIKTPIDPHPVPENKYVLIHNQSSEAIYDLAIETNPFQYQQVYITKEEDYPNLFSFLPLIFRAKQIHCINSSVFHLIDSLILPPNIELYYHDIRKDNTSFTISSKWSTVHYV